MRRRPERYLAVALHAVDPARFERCAVIRDWLGDHGVERVTLLVVPAPGLHPFPDRSPQLAQWLVERSCAGDAVAQLGLEDRGDEFRRLDADATERALLAGRNVLARAGLAPRGFVAPGYGYTPALRTVLPASFDWWADQLAVHGGADQREYAPAIPVRPRHAPVLTRLASLLPGRVLRLDIHPAYFEHPRMAAALEAAMRRAGRRTALTYDELAALARMPARPAPRGAPRHT
jgi:Uncharacterized protein conserved in bacteria (DUF2334)